MVSSSLRAQNRRIRVYELDTVLLHLLLARCQPFLALIHRLRRILHQISLVACICRIYRSALYTIVEGKAANEDSLDSRLFEHIGQIAHRYGWLAEGWSEAGVGFDSAVLAFLDEVLNAISIQFWDELAAGSVLYAVVGP